MKNISVIPLGCSEFPLALGEAFSNLVINDFKNNPNNKYHTLITHNAPVGYFFGLTMLSILKLMICRLPRILNLLLAICACSGLIHTNPIQ